MKKCVRCNGTKSYISDRERCGGCGAYVPICFEPIQGLFIAVCKYEDKHDPPSNLDLINRWLNTTFAGGDIKQYINTIKNCIARASRIIEKIEAETECKCRKCKQIDKKGNL